MERSDPKLAVDRVDNEDPKTTESRAEKPLMTGRYRKELIDISPETSELRTDRFEPRETESATEREPEKFEISPVEESRPPRTKSPVAIEVPRLIRPPPTLSPELPITERPTTDRAEPNFAVPKTETKLPPATITPRQLTAESAVEVPTESEEPTFIEPTTEALAEQTVGPFEDRPEPITA